MDRGSAKVGHVLRAEESVPGRGEGVTGRHGGFELRKSVGILQGVFIAYALHFGLGAGTVTRL